MIEIDLHDSFTAAGHREEVLRVWNEVFGAVEHANDWRETVWDRHRARAGYRLATAYDADLLVGGHFEFVELAALLDVRGQGVGGRLHDALLTDLPHHRALLGAEDDPSTPAVRLYTKRGWRRLGKQSPTDQVMGKILDGGAATV